MSSLVLIILLTFNAICNLIVEIYYFKVSRLMLIPLKAIAICRINKETKQVLSYSCTRLAIASPHAIGILYISAVAKSRGYSIVRKDSSKSSIKVEETFVDKLVEANWYCSCFLRSILEVSSDKSDFGRISLRFFCYTRGCDCIKFGAYFLFIRGPNKRIFVSCLYSCYRC